jgi:hypothetical protein
MTRAERRRAAQRQKKASRTEGSTVLRPRWGASHRSRMNRSSVIVIGGILFVALAVGVAAGLRYDWFNLSGEDEVIQYAEGEPGIEHTSDDGGFTATFPTRPTEGEITTEIGDDDVKMLRVQSEPGLDWSFAVLVADYSGTGLLTGIDPDDALVELADYVALGGDGKVVGLSHKPLVIDGVEYPGVDARITADGESVRLRGLFEGESMYVIMVSGPENKDNPDAFHRFVDSFSFTGG